MSYWRQIEERCGHLDNKELITTGRWLKKIKNQLNKKDGNFLIIVRTDANIVEGLENTIKRIKAYEDAGADMIFQKQWKTKMNLKKLEKY